MSDEANKPRPPPSSVLDFLHIVGKLKVTKRTGWVRSGVSMPESIADHMYRMAMMSFLLPDVDRDKIMKIAICHDLAEALVGDITPHCGVSKEEKNRLEREAMQKIKETVGDEAIGSELAALWQEYEDGETPEAKVVKDLDKFEMIVQAEEYERAQGVRLQEFFDSTRDAFSTPTVRAWADELRRRRDAQRPAP
eukprot:tig00001532_g9274.t1